MKMKMMKKKKKKKKKKKRRRKRRKRRGEEEFPVHLTISNASANDVEFSLGRRNTSVLRF